MQNDSGCVDEYLVVPLVFLLVTSFLLYWWVGTYQVSWRMEIEANKEVQLDRNQKILESVKEFTKTKIGE